MKSQADVQTFGQGDYVKMKELGFTTKEVFSTFQRMHFDTKANFDALCTSPSEATFVELDDTKSEAGLRPRLNSTNSSFWFFDSVPVRGGEAPGLQDKR